MIPKHQAVTRRDTEADVIGNDLRHWLSLNAFCPNCLEETRKFANGSSVLRHMRGECILESWAFGPGNVVAPLAKPQDRRRVLPRKIPINFTNREVLLAMAVVAIGLFAAGAWALVWMSHR